MAGCPHVDEVTLRLIDKFLEEACEKNAQLPARCRPVRRIARESLKESMCGKTRMASGEPEEMRQWVRDRVAGLLRNPDNHPASPVGGSELFSIKLGPLTRVLPPHRTEGVDRPPAAMASSLLNLLGACSPLSSSSQKGWLPGEPEVSLPCCSPDQPSG